MHIPHELKKNNDHDKPSLSISKDLDTIFPSLYDKIHSRNDFSKLLPAETNFVHDVSSVRQELCNIAESITQITTSINQMITDKEGDYMSTEITEKIHSIDVRLSRTETLLETINNKLDGMDRKMDTLATKEYVDKKSAETESSLLKWIIGTGLTGAAVTSGIVFGLIKIFS